MFGSKLVFGVLEEEVCGRSIQSGFVPLIASRHVLPTGTYTTPRSAALYPVVALTQSLSSR